jgi:ankyrin repeat protein
MNGDLNEQVREAVKAGDLAGVTQLLNAGASAKYVDRTGNALAHLAAMFNRYDIIELLTQHGADLWVKNPSRETPVDLAPPALQRKMKELQPQTQA